MTKVTDRGYWINDGGGHMFDQVFADGIVQVLGELAVYSVIDIGCGNGAYTDYLNRNGFGCVGYDGNPNTHRFTNGRCQVADFSVMQNLGDYDCVLSLEVGEHIPAEYEAVFLDNLVNHADKIIVMSWAVKGQGGHGHVNEHDNIYIIEQMEQRHFRLETGKTSYIRGKYSRCPWFANTAMVFARE